MRSRLDKICHGKSAPALSCRQGGARCVPAVPNWVMLACPTCLRVQPNAKTLSLQAIHAAVRALFRRPNSTPDATVLLHPCTCLTMAASRISVALIALALALGSHAAEPAALSPEDVSALVGEWIIEASCVIGLHSCGLGGACLGGPPLPPPPPEAPCAPRAEFTCRRGA